MSGATSRERPRLSMLRLLSDVLAVVQVTTPLSKSSSWLGGGDGWDFAVWARLDSAWSLFTVFWLYERELALRWPGSTDMAGSVLSVLSGQLIQSRKGSGGCSPDESELNLSTNHCT